MMQSVNELYIVLFF